MDLYLAPRSPNIRPICSLPSASPHFGQDTWASSANRSRMLPPVEVVPPASNAFRYSSATDLRCSSVICCVATAMLASPLRARVPGRQVGVDVHPHRLRVRVLVHRLEP